MRRLLPSERGISSHGTSSGALQVFLEVRTFRQGIKENEAQTYATRPEPTEENGSNVFPPSRVIAWISYTCKTEAINMKSDAELKCRPGHILDNHNVGLIH